ncbi:hypothetical protein ACFV0T_34190 [Streptomyces sp. NPDC059582]|uniref:hypothetical protein n=1 Tax=Streptomyces sp. NPDC059582 TaxID=3346875 RepID=UPI0036AC76B9
MGRSPEQVWPSEERHLRRFIERHQRSQSILNTTPEGANAPEELGSVDSRCIDDTGDAWLYAARVYAFPGSRQKVVDFYRTTAKADGWQLQHDLSDPSTPETTAGLCFTKGGDGEALLLVVTAASMQDSIASSSPLNAVPVRSQRAAVQNPNADGDPS